MPMPPYPLYCYTRDCKNLAIYKIAARWSDGVQSELKTFGLCCEDCLPAWFYRALDKQHNSRLTPGEQLDVPGIFQIERGLRDRKLQRLEDLERDLSAKREAASA